MGRGRPLLLACVLVCVEAIPPATWAVEPVVSELEWIRAFAKHSDKDNPIPTRLVKQLEEEYKRATTDPKMEHTKAMVRHLMLVTSEFTQRRSRALKGPVRVLTPPGGGTVDLSDFVTSLHGAFNLKIRVENDHHERQLLSKVYFVSQSKQTKIDGEKFGSGCGLYMDVTSFFQKSMDKGGFDLYTADQRYLFVLHGTFVFATYSPEALQLASLTFYDSRYKNWDCPQAEVL
jgi:hypothetical protein